MNIQTNSYVAMVDKIKEMKQKIISDMKSTKEKVNHFKNEKKTWLFNMVNDANEFENSMLSERAELENTVKVNNDTKMKLEMEKSVLDSMITLKENSIAEMEFIMLQRIPAEFNDLEYLFKKEIEIHNKMKTENNFLHAKNEVIIKELKEMIKMYKEVANIDMDKTKEGHLKLSFFKNLKSDKFPQDGGSLTVEIKDNVFRIVSVFPEIDISQYEKELSTTRNFTLFLSKIANDFLKLI